MTGILSIEETGIDAEGNVLFTLELDDDLHARLTAMAQERGMPVDDMVSQLIADEMRRAIAQGEYEIEGSQDALMVKSNPQDPEDENPEGKDASPQAGDPA